MARGKDYGGDYDPLTGQTVVDTSDGGAQVWYDTPPPPPPADAGQSWPVGPGWQPPLSGQSPQGGGGLSDLNAYAVAAAQQIVDNFQSLIGWPPNIDWVAAIRALVDQNLETSASAAYEYLFGNYLSDAQRAANPWAEVGMNKDTYTQTIEKLSGSYTDFTGDAMPQEILKRALKENWSPAEIKNYLTYGDPGGAKAGVAAPTLVDTPWLGAGGTYTQTRSSYYAHTGHMPTDKHTLAAWWNFGQGAQNLGSTPEAKAAIFSPAQAPPPTLGGGTEIR